MDNEQINDLTLAAGFGTRLGELPKGLIPVGETTIIGRLMKDLEQDPRIVERAIISNAKFFDQYKQWLANEGLSDSVTLLNNGALEPEDRLGAIGDLKFAIERLKWWKDNVLVTPCDTLYGPGMIGRLLDFCAGKSGLVTVVRPARKREIAGRLGCAQLKEGQVIGFEEKPRNPIGSHAAIPFYFYTPEVLEKIRGFPGKGDAPGLVIPWLIDEGVPVHAFVTQKPTLDVGTPGDLESAKLYVQVDIDLKKPKK